MRGYALTPTGFPSPADDYVDERLDVRTLLEVDRTSTFFFRLASPGYEESEGLCEGDVLVVDRGRTPAPGDLLLFTAEDGFSLARQGRGGRAGAPWGVVTGAVRRLVR